MEKFVKHRFLNSVLFTALFVPLGFFLLRDTIAAITGIMFESIGGKESFLYQINEDIARLIIAGLLILIMPLFFRGKCNFGFKGGKLALGICLALPELIVPVWNLLQIKVYEAPLVTGAAAVAAAIMHGIGPGVSEEVFCRGFTVSNLMRIWKDKPNRIFRCMLVSGVSFGLLHALNAIATGDVFAALIQVIYTASIGMLDGAIYLRSRNLWGVILMHTLTDVSAFLAVFESNATGMDIILAANFFAHTPGRSSRFLCQKAECVGCGNSRYRQYHCCPDGRKLFSEIVQCVPSALADGHFVCVNHCHSYFGNAEEVENKNSVGGNDCTADSRCYYLGCAQ